MYHCKGKLEFTDQNFGNGNVIFSFYKLLIKKYACQMKLISSNFLKFCWHQQKQTQVTWSSMKRHQSSSFFKVYLWWKSSSWGLKILKEWHSSIIYVRREKVYAQKVKKKRLIMLGTFRNLSGICHGVFSDKSRSWLKVLNYF